MSKKQELIEEIINLCPFEETIEAYINSMSAVAGDEDVDLDEVREMFDEAFSLVDMKQLTRDAMDEVYTEAELAYLLGVYKDPVGRAILIEKQPQYTAVVVQSAARAFMESEAENTGSDDLDEELDDIIDEMEAELKE